VSRRHDGETVAVGATSRRAVWGLADQAFSSLTNFAVAAIVARSVSQHEFGVFALVFATYLLALGAARAMFTVPMLVRFSGVDHSAWREATRGSTGAALTAGIVAGVVCVIVWAVLGTTPALVALGVTLPGLLLQDAWRHAFFAQGRPRSAFANDVVWAAALAVLLGTCVVLDIRSSAGYLWAWGASATAAAAFGTWQSGLVPAPSKAPMWLRAHRDLSMRQFGEFAALAGSNQIVMYIAGIVGGAITVGALRGALIVIGPLNVALQGIWIVSLPEFVRIRKRRPEIFWKTAVGVSVALTAAGLVYLALVETFATRVGPILVGATWANARDVVLPMSLTIITTGAWMGATVGLRALQENSRSLHARIATAALVVGGGTIGVFLGGTSGAAWGLAWGNIAGVVIWWAQVVRVRRDRAVSARRGSDVATDPLVSEAAI
jgi:O-antigen/teichoic acid export membrane protein